VEKDERKMSMPNLPEIVLWLIFGSLLGAGYFYLMRLTVEAIGRSSAWLPAAGYFVLRLGLAGGAFAFSAIHGAIPLLLTLCGFLIARNVVTRKYRKG
jgi:F1F0 ATPase subunit 2